MIATQFYDGLMIVVRHMLLSLLYVIVMAAPGVAADMVQVPHTPELFVEEPVALVPAQCGQCHPRQFDNLKKDGRRHQFLCQNCHTIFHAYNPLKANYSDLMPKCQNCHLKPPHGEEFTECLQCHANPHTPRKVNFDVLKDECGICHSGPGSLLAQNYSMHTSLGCITCHTKHGYIPSCLDCHDPHISGQGFQECLACHNPHKPRDVIFTGDKTKIETCKACHERVYVKWTKTESKHGKVNCGQCHLRHGQIPECQRCHDYPHGEAIHRQMPRCLDCHLDVHDLPVRPGVS